MFLFWGAKTLPQIEARILPEGGEKVNMGAMLSKAFSHFSLLLLILPF